MEAMDQSVDFVLKKYLYRTINFELQYSENKKNVANFGYLFLCSYGI